MYWLFYLILGIVSVWWVIAFMLAWYCRKNYHEPRIAYSPPVRILCVIYIFLSLLMVIFHRPMENDDLRKYEIAKTYTEYIHSSDGRVLDYDAIEEIVNINKRILTSREYYKHPYIGIMFSEEVANLELIDF